MPRNTSQTTASMTDSNRTRRAERRARDRRAHALLTTPIPTPTPTFPFTADEEAATIFNLRAAYILDPETDFDNLEISYESALDTLKELEEIDQEIFANAVDRITPDSLRLLWAEARVEIAYARMKIAQARFRAEERDWRRRQEAGGGG